MAAVKASEKELDLGSLELKMKNVQEEDWANNWKKYF
ncbi:MAG TPA: 50S ribosomal protein L11 methyltransferase, partial [Tyzzerella sp.]|nr:50S ribosomal protein L11 methyltransferase [Tyzzerella sp.]